MIQKEIPSPKIATFFIYTNNLDNKIKPLYFVQIIKYYNLPSARGDRATIY